MKFETAVGLAAIFGPIFFAIAAWYFGWGGSGISSGSTCGSGRYSYDC